MQIPRSIPVVLVLLTCNACTPAGPLSSMTVSGQVTPSPMTVSGQAFVVTKSRDNIKLALVQVAAIPENDMLEHLKKAHENGIEQQRLLMPKLQMAEKDAKAAEDKKQSTRAAFMADAEPKTEPYFQAIDRARATQSTHRKLKGEFAYFDSPAFYLEGLPAATGVGKTDADGKFTLTVPSGKYVIAALTKRSVFKDTEEYYWLVKVDASSPIKFLMLSNDNFVDTKCNECVLIPASK